MKGKSLSHVRLLATPWTEAYQAPPSMGFSRQEYWSGVPLPSPIKRLRLFLTPPCATWGLTSGVDHVSLIADKTVSQDLPQLSSLK